MNKKVINIILLSLSSLLISFGIASIGAFNNNVKIVVGSIIYFFLAAYLPKKMNALNKWLILFLISYPILFLQLSVNIIDYKDTINSLPIHLFFLISCVLGFIYGIRRYLAFPFMLFSFLVIYFAVGKKQYLNYRHHGSVTLAVNKTSPNLALYDSTNLLVELPADKIVILDFWNSKCAPCYREFPFIDSIYKTMSKDKFYVAVVNIPVHKEIYTENFYLLDEFGYSFNKLYAIDDKILDSLNIKSYPTTVAISKGSIIYKGAFRDIIEKVGL